MYLQSSFICTHLILDLELMFELLVVLLILLLHLDQEEILLLQRVEHLLQLVRLLEVHRVRVLELFGETERSLTVSSIACLPAYIRSQTPLLTSPWKRIDLRTSPLAA